MATDEAIDFLQERRRKDRSFSDTMRDALHLFVFACITVFIGQQAVLIYETWGQETQAFILAETMFYTEQCATYNGPWQGRLDQCQKINITLNTMPVVSAVMKVINSWNSCVYMPCSTIVNELTNHWHYKILFILISLGIFSYFLSVLNFTKKKSKKLYDYTQPKFPPQDPVLKEILNKLSISSSLHTQSLDK
jgi:hypothetical protein